MINPEEFVTTYDGTKARRRNCRRIKNEYYIENKQCFCVGGKWHRVNNGLIVFDHETKEWVKKGNTELKRGVVDYDGKKAVIGYFTVNPSKNVCFFFGNDYGTHACISEEVAIKCGGVEAIQNGQFYDINSYRGTKKNFQIFTTTKKTQSFEFYTFPISYNAKTNLIQFLKEYNTKYKAVHAPLSIPYSKLIKNWTFGVEYETAHGTIPERHLRDNGLIACRDGSIAGFEYVSVPLYGEKGLKTIFDHCHLLQKYCIVDSNCALHVHIGGYKVTQEHIIALYRLLVSIQSEVYQLFPIRFRKTSTFKKRDYNNPLTPIPFPRNANIKEAFSRLYEHLSGGYKFEEFNFVEHPLDRDGDHKWNIASRYTWVNLIPLIWGGRKTVEFRVHVATSNPLKIIYWIYVCIAVLKYADKHIDDLISARLPSVSLREILKDTYEENSKEVFEDLCKYLRWRKNHYKGGADQIGQEEIQTDNEFKGFH